MDNQEYLRNTIFRQDQFCYFVIIGIGITVDT